MINFPTFVKILISDKTCAKGAKKAITMPLDTYIERCFVHVTNIIAFLAAQTTHVWEWDYRYM